MWEFLRRLFRRAPKLLSYVWRVEEGLPAGVKTTKPYKPSAGWVNLHVRREDVKLLGETSVKTGLPIVVIVRALFVEFARWSEYDRRRFVEESQQRGTDVPQETAGLTPEIIYLSPDGLTPKEPEMKAVKAQLAVMELERRECPAAALPRAVVDGDTLHVTGTNASETIRVADDNLDNILEVTVNNVAVPIKGVADKTLIDLISIKGKAGDDVLVVDASVNVLDAAGVLVDSADTRLDGGKGNDTFLPQNGGIVGGLAGVDANGVVVGLVVGNSKMTGGDGDDTLISGPGNDTIKGGKGDDNYVWPPGTLTDTFDGGKGLDTATIIGNDGAGDSFNLFRKGGGALFTRDNLIQFSVGLKHTEVVNLSPGTGDDTINVGNLDKSKIQVVNVDGGDGTDVANVAAQNKVQVNLANIEIANLDAVFAELGRKR